MNPIPYYAQYFGHKFHVDQNEKLAMFGVTHVIAIDGYSSKIVGWSTMPVKNNLVIYDEVYRLVYWILYTWIAILVVRVPVINKLHSTIPRRPTVLGG